MKDVYVVFWSASGNTEAMARMIGEGIELGGANPKVVEVSSISPEALDDANVYALGCPSMGAEELEEDSMEPFVTSLEGRISGKQILLFGSYGWGDGEWMRNWVERMSNAGATIVGGEGLMANETPDEDALDACKEAGKTLAGL